MATNRTRRRATEEVVAQDLKEWGGAASLNELIGTTGLTGYTVGRALTAMAERGEVKVWHPNFQTRRTTIYQLLDNERRNPKEQR